MVGNNLPPAGETDALVPRPGEGGSREDSKASPAGRQTPRPLARDENSKVPERAAVHPEQRSQSGATGGRGVLRGGSTRASVRGPRVRSGGREWQRVPAGKIS